jgi:hypothetical protein
VFDQFFMRSPSERRLPLFAVLSTSRQQKVATVG